jgi:hypothetical protein
MFLEKGYKIFKLNPNISYNIKNIPRLIVLVSDASNFVELLLKPEEGFLELLV